MRLRHVALALAPVLIFAACSSGGSSGSPLAASASPSPVASGAGQRIEVKLSDALKMEPAAMTAKVGQSVTFVVTNTGSTEHEFYVGDEAAQMKHNEEMMGMSQMAHDEAMGIGVKPGETKELTITFPTAGALIAGCHVSGHYAAGMKATIEVE